ncbi:hypothetical protein [Streptomyces sp. NPDC059708]|uniref:hypothetical protein n=1 Tax=Streptomyces sp. NPDC059708 TaxID=3346916 RepID=UPI0036AAF053
MAAQYNTLGDCEECGADDGDECWPGCVNHPDSHPWEDSPEAPSPYEEPVPPGW